MINNNLNIKTGQEISGSVPVTKPAEFEHTVAVLSSSPMPVNITTPALKEVNESYRSILNPPCIDSHEPEGNPLTKSEVLCLRGEEEGTDSGKEITYEYKHKGTVFGKETVERREAVKDLQESLVKRMKDIENQLIEKKKDPHVSPKVVQRLEKELQLCKNSYENAKKVKDEFIKSSFYRDELGKVVNNSREKNYSEAVNQISLGAAVNFRYQKGEAGGKETGFFRLGVITDPRNGFTHLGELKAFSKNSKLLQDKLKILGKKHQKYLKSPEKNRAKLEATQYAIAQLHPQQLGETIREREFVLENQMLQLVQGQVEKNLAKIQMDEKQTILPLVHVALLNREIDKVDPSGWVHNEANEMADMHEIFKEFAGKILIFDGKGPYIDVDGNVHLAQSLIGEDGKARQMKLDSTFVNISVQGHCKNDGIQREINKDSIPHLIAIATKKAQAAPQNKEIREGLKLLLDVERKLKEDKSTYQIAEDLSVAFLKLGIPLSIGCLSAKDRTGYVGARLIVHFVGEEMENHPQLQESPNAFKKLKHKFELSVLDKDACATKTVEDNTKVNVLKCSAFSLPGYSAGVAGKARRLGYYIQQASINFASASSAASFLEGQVT